MEYVIVTLFYNNTRKEEEGTSEKRENKFFLQALWHISESRKFLPFSFCD